MPLSPSIVELQLYTVVKAFIVTVTGLNANLVLRGKVNRSAMPPASPGFVTMQLTGSTQLNYPMDTWSLTSPNPTFLSSESHWKERMQIDFYGGSAGDWAKAFAGLWKDETAALALAPVCEPLYADDPVLAPLDDGEEQYELRRMVNSYLQYNPVTMPLMQFMAPPYGPVTLINVDEAYPH
jgi:hypothetical protein